MLVTYIYTILSRREWRRYRGWINKPRISPTFLIPSLLSEHILKKKSRQFSDVWQYRDRFRVVLCSKFIVLYMTERQSHALLSFCFNKFLATISRIIIIWTREKQCEDNVRVNNFQMFYFYISTKLNKRRAGKILSSEFPFVETLVFVFPPPFVIAALFLLFFYFIVLPLSQPLAFQVILQC